MNPVFKGCAQEMKGKRCCKKELREQWVLLRIVSEKLKIPANQLRRVKMLGTIQRTFRVRCQDPGLVPQYPCYLLLYLHLYIIITDIYNYVSESLRKVIIYLLMSIQKHQGRQNISERIIKSQPYEIYPLAIQKTFLFRTNEVQLSVILDTKVQLYHVLYVLGFPEVKADVPAYFTFDSLGSSRIIVFGSLSFMYIFVSFYGMRK